MSLLRGFAFFAAMAETERENIRQSTLEGLGTAAPTAPTAPTASRRRRAPPPVAQPVCRLGLVVRGWVNSRVVQPAPHGVRICPHAPTP